MTVEKFTDAPGGRFDVTNVTSDALMHPALSVILFTTASGAGYGLLMLLGLFGALGLLPAEPGFGIAAFGLALGLISFGLLASTFHLGRPERAWRAFSQWRTSWLSREGVVSVATYLPALGFAFGWISYGRNSGGWAVLGLLAALGAISTLICTGMIYASLATVQRWHNRWVVPNYLALGLMSGAVLLDALARLAGYGGTALTVTALVLIALAVRSSSAIGAISTAAPRPARRRPRPAWPRRSGCSRRRTPRRII
jgi:DMSO reductase anchor subunit